MPPRRRSEATDASARPWLERPRLSRLLGRAFEADVTTVVADAGYGKTALLEMWSRGGRCAVVSVMTAHSGTHLKRAVIGAIEPYARVPADVIAGTDDEFAAAVAAALADQDPVLLAFDDLQDASSEAECLIDALIRRASESFGIVLSSRGPVSAIVAPKHDAAPTIGSEDLAFTIAEAIDLAGLYGIDDRDSVRQAHEATEGWPAALCMELDALRQATSDASGSGRPAIRTLGGFGVRVGRRAVPATEWQSKKSRDLLKILIARRGRPVAREELMDLLWPGEDSAKLAHRLSVALATLRGVLDREKAFPPDRYIGGDARSLWINRDRVEIDIERFLQFADSARRSGSRAEMRAAEAIYTGDFLDEDPYAEWAGALRDEARIVFTVLEHHLAVEAEERGWHDAAVRHWLRVLERDAYDEHAHTGLVRALRAAGRHGEAKRRYQTYVAAMNELGIEPAAFPDSR